MVFAAAGHPGPLVLRASGEVENPGEPGTLLGIFEHLDVSETRVESAQRDDIATVAIRCDAVS